MADELDDLANHTVTTRGSLTPHEVTTELAALGERWSIDGPDLRLDLKGSMTKTGAVAAHIGALADELDHHPSLSLEYAGLVLKIHTHDKGAITVLDLVFAARLEQSLRAKAGPSKRTAAVGVSCSATDTGTSCRRCMVGAVEVVAKLGDSIIEIARVERGGVYASPLVPFPLVCCDASGFVVHRPIGVGGWRCGVPIEGTSLRVAVGDSIVLELGRVMLYVLPITDRAVAIPKRRSSAPWLYGAVVMLVHLFVWGLAEATAPAPPPVAIVKPLPTRRVHVAHVEPPPPPPPPRITAPSKTTAEPASARPAKAKSGRVRGGTRAPGEQAFLGAFGDVSSLIPSVDVVAMVNESVLYDEQAPRRRSSAASGGSIRWPTARRTAGRSRLGPTRRTWSASVRSLRRPASR